METFPSVGGQIIPPEGYLAQVYSKIRKHGGVCIADEVQTGLGRLGDYYFGFEFQKVIPDIVVLGKPLGNGHPIGAVITTKQSHKALIMVLNSSQLLVVQTYPVELAKRFWKLLMKRNFKVMQK